jgi:putative acetyltransferase
MIEIRLEQPSDIEEIRNIYSLSFGQPQEGSIVDKLRVNCNEIVSLVAVSGKKVVGHILFSPAILEGKTNNIKGMGIAPMAVLPEFQNRGIGSKLVREGINKLKTKEYSFIIVLGHAKFYPRFGFERASKYGINCQWEGVPDDAFMILVLNAKEIEGISGTAKYRDEFNDAV